MKLILTLQELMDNYDWDKACEILGINPWCINEGLATGDEEEYITEEQARQIGILPFNKDLISRQRHPSSVPGCL